jgi:hypothetical protein
MMIYSEFTHNKLLEDKHNTIEERLAQRELVREALSGRKPGLVMNIIRGLAQLISNLMHEHAKNTRVSSMQVKHGLIHHGV